MNKPKFEVGDRVENEYRGEGTIIYITKRFMLYLVEYDRKIVGGHNGNGICDVKGKEGHCYYENASDLKRVEEKDMKETIVIYRDGKETIALFKQDNKVIRKAVARCHPEDTYNFKIGADIAYKRLMGNPEPDKSDSDTNHVYTDKEWQEVEKVYRDRCNEIVDIKAELRCVNDNCDYWKSKSENLEEQLTNHKKYAEKLKAEIEKLKGCNEKITVSDTVQIVDSGDCYFLYEKWINKYFPKFAKQWNELQNPKNGDIGFVMAKAKHFSCEDMLCAVLIDGQVYVMGERGIKLCNS